MVKTEILCWPGVHWKGYSVSLARVPKDHTRHVGNVVVENTNVSETEADLKSSSQCFDAVKPITGLQGVQAPLQL